jgi:hypothetical protein
MKKEYIIRLIKVALKDMFIYRKLSELGFQSEHHTPIPEILLNIRKPTHNEQEFLEHLMLFEQVYQLCSINEPKALEVIASNIYSNLINL